MGSKSWLMMVGVLLVMVAMWLWLADGTAAPLPRDGSGADGRAPGYGETASAAASQAVEREVVRLTTATAGRTGRPALEGIVAAVAGQALPGATVTLFAGMPRDDVVPLATTTTDADGRFHIDSPLGDGSWFLRATAVDHLPATVGNAGDRRPLTIRLLPCIEVFGRVLAKNTGVPIAGAVVRDGKSTVTCDEVGRYEIRASTSQGHTSLMASAGGFTDAKQVVRRHESERTELDFLLAPTASMTVQVVDRETGAPVVGAAVRPSERGPMFAETGTDGRFVVEAGEGQHLHLHVAAEGFCSLTWSWHVDDGPLPWPRLPLIRAARIEGMVTDGHGRGLEAAIEVENELAGGDETSAHWSPEELEAAHVPGILTCVAMPAVAASDGSGQFVVPVRPQVRARRVVATLPGCVAAESEFIGLTEPRQVVRVELVLVPGGGVRGNLLRNGQPAQGIVRWQHGRRGGVRRVDATGSYVLLGVPAGPVELTLVDMSSQAPVATATVQVVAGEDVQHDFVWQQPTGTIRGRVTTQSGLPIAGVAVHASDSMGHALTDAAGGYSMEVPDGGTYRVTVHREGVLRQHEGIRANTTGLDFVLPDIGAVRLRLVDAQSGRPVRVGAERSRFGWREAGGKAFAGTQGMVDHAGLVMLRVPIGIVDVAIDLHESGYRPIERAGIRVTTNERPDEVLIELTRGVQLRLSVRGDTLFSGEVRKGHAFFALEHAQRESVRGPIELPGEASTHTFDDVAMWLGDRWLTNQMPDFDDSGRATVTALAPGRYHLAAFPDDLLFEPSTFAVGPGDTDVELRWRRR